MPLPLPLPRDPSTVLPSPPATPQATLAAANVAAVLSGYPVWNRTDILPFVEKPMAAVPRAAPSIVNAKELGLKMATE